MATLALTPLRCIYDAGGVSSLLKSSSGVNQSSETCRVKLSSGRNNKLRSLRIRASQEQTAATVEEVEKPKVVEGGCPSCGKPEIGFGCNGEGRIQGGIGAVPGFRWWPIKAYRPCPAFLEAGGRYRRTGQSLDEVAFGKKTKGDDLDITERLSGKE